MSKSILITGASSGIGRALAVLMVQEGWAVGLAARSKDKLEESAALCKAAAPACRTRVFPCDVADPQAAKKAVNATHAQLGALGALANVAGYAPMGSLQRVSDADVRQCLGVNLEAVIWTTRAAWPHFLAQGGGTIVNVSSMASVDPFPGFNVYAAAKAGVNLFTQATGKEGEAHGIRAYAAAPGCVETPMLRSLFNTETVKPEQCLSPQAVAQVLRDCITGQQPEKNGSVILLPGP